MSEYVVGVDLGGTKVEACLMNTHQEVISRRRQFSNVSGGLDAVLDTIQSVISDAAGDTPYKAIGIGTPGTYVPENDCLFGSPHTPLYETPGFIGKLRHKLNVPLLVENDANCLALAEFFASCKGKYKYVMAVVIGTGMGSGLILNDKLYLGSKRGAGEIGHTTIQFKGRTCECGRSGCAEAYLSGPSLTRRYREECGETVPVPGIYERYLQGDSAANELFEESLTIMADVFANAVNIFDLEAIILGGGVSNLPLWYEKLPPLFEKKLFGVPRGKIPILQAQLGDSAGVLGAAYLALRHLGKKDF